MDVNQMFPVRQMFLISPKFV